MNDPLQLGTVGLVIGALIAAAKLIEWVHKSDLKAIGQFGRWGAVGLFALSVPLLFGLLMNRRWTEAIGLSAVILVAFAVYGPRILGQLRPRPPVAAEPGGPGKRAEHKAPADAAANEAEMVKRAIAVLRPAESIDLVIANAGDSNICILVGNGTGGFGAPINFATGPSDHSPTVADLNHDGQIDLEDARFLYDEIEQMLGEPDSARFQGGMGYYPGTAAHPPFVHVDVRGTAARWKG